MEKEKEYQIGDLVILKGREKGYGRVIDTRDTTTFAKKKKKTVLVGYRVPYKGKLFLQTQWVHKDNLTLHNPKKPCFSNLLTKLRYMLQFVKLLFS